MCLMLGYKLRSRKVLKQASAGGLECRALQEVEICDHPSWYQFHVGNWRACRLLKDHHLNCGAGQRKRTVECLTLGGVSILFFIGLINDANLF